MKRKRDDDKKKKMNEFDIKVQERGGITSDLISKILNDEDVFATKDDNDTTRDLMGREDLKISSYVVDLQIPAPVSCTTFIL